MKLIMISAMYENGGNVTHRLLDGHPELLVYPFESQLGTKYVQDHLSSLFPLKYRWPLFPLDQEPRADFKAIIDEECKVRARTPNVSKFRFKQFDLDDDQRMEHFVQEIERVGRSRANLVAAFFRATFKAWTNAKVQADANTYVGYSPIIAVDADKMLQDFPNGHMIHVVRNPWSAYAETKKRPVPLSLPTYLTAWCTVQYHARAFQRQFPKRLHIVRYEDIIADPEKTLGAICKKIDLQPADTLTTPSWNAEKLERVYPWGTIEKPATQVNQETAATLSAAEHRAVTDWASDYLDFFDYKSMA